MYFAKQVRSNMKKIARKMFTVYSMLYVIIQWNQEILNRFAVMEKLEMQVFVFTLQQRIYYDVWKKIVLIEVPLGFSFSFCNQLLVTLLVCILISCNFSRICIIGDVLVYQVK